LAGLSKRLGKSWFGGGGIGCLFDKSMGRQAALGHRAIGNELKEARSFPSRFSVTGKRSS